jgi:hypothetical protein
MYIFIKDQKIYYKKSNKDTLNLVTLDNWKKCFKKSGWDNFPDEWNSIIEFDRLGVKENYGDGDCLFLSISYGLNIDNQLKNKEKKISVKSLRNLVSENINDDNFEEILNYYKIEKDNKELLGNWNPYQIKNARQFKNLIKKSGNYFWGDYLTISILSNKLKVNFIVLDGNFNNIYKLGENIKEYDNTIILFYENMIHFKLVGYFDNNKIITIFDKDKLPDSIYRLYKK